MSTDNLLRPYEEIPLEATFSQKNVKKSDSKALRKLPSEIVSSQYSLIGSEAPNEDEDHDSPRQPFTRIASDWWTRQMLVDRSLRTMAATTALFAIAIYIVIFVFAGRFRERLNQYSTSVGGATQSCRTVKTTNMILLFVVNIAATMILGMSNTYQQLVAALKVEDLRHALEKYGDSRVGTNSPFTINHKRTGKFRAWMCWLLLIVTSMPVHLLVNSLIGPSYIYSADIQVDLRSAPPEEVDRETNSTDGRSYLCWTAFRTGKIFVDLPEERSLGEPMQSYGDMELGTRIGEVRQPQRLTVLYSGSCQDFAGQADTWEDIRGELVGDPFRDPEVGNCSTYSYDSDNFVGCHFSGIEDTECRLNVRMLAAFILAVGLTIKAIYMITVNIRARGRVKTTCLTFGDVIVAAASDPDLRIYNECMVNASDHYRYLVAHSCHKHCTDTTESKTGDELGHCQKCKKFNRINKSANLEQPRTATKMKRSLVSLLGGTTLPQLILLSMCSAGLLIIAILMAASVSAEIQERNMWCPPSGSNDEFCSMTMLQKIHEVSGGWESAGFHSFGPDSISNEFFAMLIANSAQTFYSFIYLLLIYNISLISQEYAWGKLEHGRGRLRCTINKSHKFEESYLLQLPQKILIPVMAYSVLIHWLLGECIQMKEFVWKSVDPPRERSYYVIAYAIYPIWVTTALILFMTAICWWAYTFKRQGFIPQMYGSVRVCCAAATELDSFSKEGIKWGDLGEGKKFRHAGFSSSAVDKIKPHELYSGRGIINRKRTQIQN